MGLFSFIRDKFEDAVDWVKDKAEMAVDWIKDKLSFSEYDEDDIEDHVDVDAVLAEFREKVRDDVNNAEKKCMKSISDVFTDLIRKTQDKFPDLVEIIDNEQQEAERELTGTYMKYVKEHLSKNDEKFLNVLKMKPGKAKDNALELALKNIMDNAERTFYSKLKKYAEHVLTEFTNRLNNRMIEQEKQVTERINELEKLKLQAESGIIDVDALKDKSAPVMEASACIIQLCRMEM